jgi:hypothetical protein
MTRRIQRLRRERLDSRIPHIRYNFEVKPRDADDPSHDSEHVVRFNFVVLAKDPKKVSDLIVALISQYDGAMNMVRDVASEVVGNKGFRYILRTVDANVKPDLVPWARYGEKFKMKIKRDPNLREQSGITLEDYVVRTYS